MAVDFNTASEQGGGAAPIPDGSVVIVCADIREPKAGKQGTVNPLFCAADSGYEFLDFEFTVLSTRFKDRKIWQNFMLHYNKPATENSSKAISISMKTLRAIVEAHRKISPKDSSPTATKARIINDFSDIRSMVFPIEVGCEWSKPNRDGKRYLNNTIKRIITPDDERFEKVFAHPEGCLVSDKPLPPEPTAAETSPKPAWVKEEPKKEEPKQAEIPGVKAANKPAWVK